ncbi:hypothetical protein Bca52824_028700 [Brassica carinata]|uniref:Uncharacterized protein n=1 Tax=Brassica carinata TaxID=52824 RepID=A0A8X8AS02_BRACI|nr:hypothetical protein Bca52824_028700 [Brassica carinata]
MSLCLKNHVLLLTNSFTQILASVSCLILGVIGEIQHVGNMVNWIDPSSLDCLSSATTNSNNKSMEDEEGTSVLFSIVRFFGALVESHLQSLRTNR